jgi:hypothetical protein
MLAMSELEHLKPAELQYYEDDTLLAVMHGRRYVELLRSEGTTPTGPDEAAIGEMLALARAIREERCSRSCCDGGGDGGVDASSGSSSAGVGGGGGSSSKAGNNKRSSGAAGRSDAAKVPKVLG